MFRSARLKLTAWYLLILMSISILFSVVIYKDTTTELERSLRAQQFRIYIREHPDIIPPPPSVIYEFNIDSQLLNDEEARIGLSLLFINLGILIFAGGAGYFLAGRTLRPIQQMVDEQNRFITDASHELRTPLTALRSEIEVNLRDQNFSVDDARKLLKSNLEEVEHLQTLSNSLLTLAQFEQQQTSINSSLISIKSVVEEAIKKILPMAKSKQIAIDSAVYEYQLYGDHQSLLQLCIILLDNAVKYSHSNTAILVSTTKIDHTIRLTIVDHGIGIEQKDIPHIFERFYRADRSRSKHDVAGYGLGLSIAKKIVDEHNGTISLRSKKNTGTTFIVNLPLPNL